ncbi:restriction endonuclease subunit S [Corynebacterium hindlerae]|uniref:restriction endonuclease subunit S n=1 Tax=Corynebacterium hindlerae TaxID=699041 RepID=UPI003AADA8FD
MLVTEVFDSVQASQAWYDKNKLLEGEGPYPYVSRSLQNNGVESFIIKQDKIPNEGNAVTIGVDTQSVFYQPAPFYTSVKIQVLRSQRLDEFNGPFLVMLLRAQMSKFQWGNGVSLARLKSTHIMVPVVTSANGQMRPDWEGMTALGRELRDKTLQSRENAMTTSIHEDAELPELDFAPMLLTEIFESVKGAGKWFNISDVTPHERTPKYPYVSRSGGKNGIDSFITKHGVQPPNSGNCITIGVSTATVFYQPVDFYTSREIQVLRHHRLDQYNGLMLVEAIRHQMSKFQWGNGASLPRLKATRIMVPVVTTPSGETVPDWEGMTAYGRAMRVRVENAVRAGSPSFQGMSSNA